MVGILDAFVDYLLGSVGFGLVSATAIVPTHGGIKRPLKPGNGFLGDLCDKSEDVFDASTREQTKHWGNLR